MPFSKTVLVVDENKDILRLFDHWSPIVDVETKTTTNPESAFIFLVEIGFRIGAVVLDLSMPTDDGLSFTEKIRKNELLRGEINIPIFWYTAYTINSIIEKESKCYNINEIFKKPLITPDFVLLKIKDVLGW